MKKIFTKSLVSSVLETYFDNPFKVGQQKLNWDDLTVFENHRTTLRAKRTTYVYILSGQKFNKNRQFGEFLKSWMKLAIKQC